MSQKPSNFNFVIRLTVILCFFALLIFPIALMALDGPDSTAMESEATVELKGFSLGSYLDGNFQSSFESWFSGHYPLRSQVVKTYKQTRYDIENSSPVVAVMQLLSGTLGEDTPDDPATDPNSGVPNWPGLPSVPSTPSTPTTPTEPNEPIDPNVPVDPDAPVDPETPVEPTEPVDPYAIYLDPSNIYAEINRRQLAEIPVEPKGYRGSDRVYIGKSGYLYESSYIMEYMGYDEPYTSVTREGVKTTVEKLEYIQQELKKRGIEMLFVLTSSKAAAYSAYIPEYFKNMYIVKEGYVRPVDMLREELANSTVNYLDSAVYWQQIGLLNTFPKTGIHWNAPASFETTAQLVRMYQQLSGRTTVTLSAKGVIYHDDAPSSFNNEKDVFNILYGALVPSNAIVDEDYYSPDVVVTNAGAKKLNVLLQGGSFAGSINHYLENYGVADVDYIYYNGQHGHGSITASNPWEKGPEAWAYWLKGRDLVIFESTEQQVRGYHYDGSKPWSKIYNDSNYGHNAVYDSMYEYLKAHEGEY